MRKLLREIRARKEAEAGETSAKEKQSLHPASDRSIDQVEPETAEKIRDLEPKTDPNQGLTATEASPQAKTPQA
jgi:hypothetical protein